MVSVRWRDPNGRFCITQAEIKGKVVGVCGELEPVLLNQSYSLWGKWDTHPKYGEQFKFRVAQFVFPTKVAEIPKWMAIHFNINPSQAQAWVDTAGTEVWDWIVQNDPKSKLASFIRANRIDVQKELAWEDELGITFYMRKTLEKDLGKDWRAKIKANPYQLVIRRMLSFSKVDKLAVELLGPEHPERLWAATIFSFHEEEDLHGHTMLPEKTLAKRLSGLEVTVTPIAWQTWLKDERLKKVSTGVQLGTRYDQEDLLARWVVNRMKIRLTPLPIDLADLASDQKMAALKLADKSFGLLVGAPGSGKTTLCRKWMEAFPKGSRLVGCAPTGQAARKLREVCGDLAECSTIHKLLKARAAKDTEDWKFTAEAEDFQDVAGLVLDEASMPSLDIFLELFQRMPETARILLVGDNYQLPSIEAGAVLRDLIAVGVPCGELTEIKRNSGDLTRGIHAMRRGEEPKWSTELDEAHGKNLRFVEVEDEDIISTLKAGLDKLRDLEFDPLWDTQVLSLFNDRTNWGCTNLNKELRHHLKYIAADGWAIGEKVVRLRNGIAPMHDKEGSVEVVNGDFGCVVGVDKNKLAVRHENPDRVVDYKMTDPFVRRAYSATVHRMQGSSAPVILVVLPTSFNGMMLSREWLYTAVSRGERITAIFGSRAMFLAGLKRTEGDWRKTHLREKILALRAV